MERPLPPTLLPATCAQSILLLGRRERYPFFLNPLDEKEKFGKSQFC